jgi:hypothetical protein
VVHVDALGAAGELLGHDGLAGFFQALLVAVGLAFAEVGGVVNP